MSSKTSIASASPAPSSAMPCVAEILQVFDVPSHREASVRKAYADNLASIDTDRRMAGFQPSGFLESLPVSPSRAHRATNARIRRMAAIDDDLESDGDEAASEIGLVISRGRWRVVIQDLEVAGAVTIAAALRRLPCQIDPVGAHTLSVAILDLVTEPDSDDKDPQDEVAGWRSGRRWHSPLMILI